MFVTIVNGQTNERTTATFKTDFIKFQCELVLKLKDYRVSQKKRPLVGKWQ